MKPGNRCKTIEMELTAWKTMLDDIYQELDMLPTLEKGRLQPNIEDIHILVEEMDERIDQIKVSCAPEAGMDDILTEREKFGLAAAKSRMESKKRRAC